MVLMAGMVSESVGESRAQSDAAIKMESDDSRRENAICAGNSIVFIARCLGRVQ